MKNFIAKQLLQTINLKYICVLQRTKCLGVHSILNIWNLLVSKTSLVFDNIRSSIKRWIWEMFSNSNTIKTWAKIQMKGRNCYLKNEYNILYNRVYPKLNDFWEFYFKNKELYLCCKQVISWNFSQAFRYLFMMFVQVVRNRAIKIFSKLDSIFQWFSHTCPWSKHWTGHQNNPVE